MLLPGTKFMITDVIEKGLTLACRKYNVGFISTPILNGGLINPFYQVMMYSAIFTRIGKKGKPRIYQSQLHVWPIRKVKREDVFVHSQYGAVAIKKLDQTNIMDMNSREFIAYILSWYSYLAEIAYRHRRLLKTRYYELSIERFIEDVYETGFYIIDDYKDMRDQTHYVRALIDAVQAEYFLNKYDIKNGEDADIGIARRNRLREKEELRFVLARNRELIKTDMQFLLSQCPDRSIKRDFIRDVEKVYGNIF